MSSQLGTLAAHCSYTYKPMLKAKERDGAAMAGTRYTFIAFARFWKNSWNWDVVSVGKIG
jgi:hypothetical protein